jgi:hypothetical protein
MLNFKSRKETCIWAYCFLSTVLVVWHSFQAPFIVAPFGCMTMLRIIYLAVEFPVYQAILSQQALLKPRLFFTVSTRWFFRNTVVFYELLNEFRREIKHVLHTPCFCVISPMAIVRSFFLCDAMNAKINTSIYTWIVLYCGRWWLLLVVHCVGWDQTEGLFGVSLRDGACYCAKSPAYTNILQRLSFSN